MQCDPETRCPAKETLGEECWDIMGSHNPCAFNICRDCLVYVVKKKDPQPESGGGGQHPDAKGYLFRRAEKIGRNPAFPAARGK